jgi:CheY-specific phosphatase CheX
MTKLTYTDELGLVFAEAISDIVLKFSGVSLNAISSEPDESFETITGVMSLAGERGGTLLISASEADMRVFCSRMTAVPIGKVTPEETEDALCELVNMTAGSAQQRLSGMGHAFTLTMPFVLRGENMRMRAKKRVEIVSKFMSDGELSLKLKFMRAHPL